MLKTLKIILLVGLSLINGDFDSKKLNNTPMSIYDIPINSIDGNEMNLNEYKGKFILFVNVASNCGFTRQYKDLQQLYTENSDKLVVIGVPLSLIHISEPTRRRESRMPSSA